MEASARCEIDLLGERRIDTQIDEKLIAEDLLNLASSHLKLREREYFGLSWEDEDGHLHWLQSEKMVLDQVTENCIQQQGNGEAKIVLHFMVKYYVPTIALLSDAATVEAFFMQAKLLMSKGVLEPDSQTEYRLTALALQANFGDWTRDTDAKLRLRQMGFPSPSLTKHKSVDYCERKIHEDYKSFVGFSRGNAIIQYMNMVEGLATYGIHFYRVQQKDRNGPLQWIGLSHRGLSEYDLNNRKVPKKFYQWKYMENIYYRETKFSIEINNPKGSTSTLSGNASVIVWYAANAALNKTIWSMAIAQHQFHMDHRRARKQTPDDFLKLQRISQELNSQSQMTIRSSLSRIALAFEGKDDDKATTEVKLSRLSVKKSALVEILRKKLKELQDMCRKESEMTGTIDVETPTDNDIANPTLRKAKPLVDRNANEMLVPVACQKTSISRRVPPPLPTSHSLDRLKARSPVVIDQNENAADTVDAYERPRSNTLGRDLSRHSSNSNLKPSPRSSISSTSTSPIPPVAAYSAPSSPKLQHSELKRYVPSIAQQSTHTSYRRAQYPPVYKSSRSDGGKPPAYSSGTGKMRAPSPLLEARAKYEGPLERVNHYSVKTQRLSQAFSSHDNIPALLQKGSEMASINMPGLPPAELMPPPAPPPLPRHVSTSSSVSSLAPPVPPVPPPQPKPKKDWTETNVDDACRKSPIPSPVPVPGPGPGSVLVGPGSVLVGPGGPGGANASGPGGPGPMRDEHVSREPPRRIPDLPPPPPPPPALPIREPQAQASTVVRTSAAATAVVVEQGKFKPYYEETKPFEMSDFYKYSQRHRNS